MDGRYRVKCPPNSSSATATPADKGKGGKVGADLDGLKAHADKGTLTADHLKGLSIEELQTLVLHAVGGKAGKAPAKAPSKPASKPKAPPVVASGPVKKFDAFVAAAEKKPIKKPAPSPAPEPDRGSKFDKFVAAAAKKPAPAPAAAPKKAPAKKAAAPAGGGDPVASTRDLYDRVASKDVTQADIENHVEGLKSLSKGELAKVAAGLDMAGADKWTKPKLLAEIKLRMEARKGAYQRTSIADHWFDDLEREKKAKSSRPKNLSNINAKEHGDFLVSQLADLGGQASVGDVADTLGVDKAKAKAALDDLVKAGRLKLKGTDYVTT